MRKDCLRAAHDSSEPVLSPPLHLLSRGVAQASAPFPMFVRSLRIFLSSVKCRLYSAKYSSILTRKVWALLPFSYASGCLMRADLGMCWLGERKRECKRERDGSRRRRGDFRRSGE